jgi:hypothetical protein
VGTFGHGAAFLPGPHLMVTFAGLTPGVMLPTVLRVLHLNRVPGLPAPSAAVGGGGWQIGERARRGVVMCACRHAGRPR